MPARRGKYWYYGRSEDGKNYSDAVIIESADQLPAPTGAPGVPTRNIGGRLGKRCAQTHNPEYGDPLPVLL